VALVKSLIAIVEHPWQVIGTKSDTFIVITHGFWEIWYPRADNDAANR